MPVDLLRQVSADERRDEASEIDSHVKNRVPRIATAIAGLVQLSHHSRSVRLEQTSAEHHQSEAGIEPGCRWDGQHEVAGRDDRSANDDGAASAEDMVRE